jgi:hypothetical protein
VSAMVSALQIAGSSSTTSTRVLPRLLYNMWVLTP